MGGRDDGDDDGDMLLFLGLGAASGFEGLLALFGLPFRSWL